MDWACWSLGGKNPVNARIRIVVLTTACIIVVGCADRIEDISATGGLAPAIGECIEIIERVGVYPVDPHLDADLLVLMPGDSRMERNDVKYFPRGTHILVRRFVAEKTAIGDFFWIYGTVQDRPGPIREVNLQSLVNFDWVSDSVARIESGRLPVLPPTKKIPLKLDVAKPCD